MNSFLDKDLEAALDSFDNLFCRRCLVTFLYLLQIYPTLCYLWSGIELVSPTIYWAGLRLQIAWMLTGSCVSCKLII